jgi:hypothetical protein
MKRLFLSACLVFSLSGVFAQEKTSFDEVTSQLTKGGNLYLYLSTEDALKTLEDKIVAVKNILAKQPANPGNPEDAPKVQKAMDLFLKIFRQSGINEISGIGISSNASGQLYSNRVVVYHYPENNKGRLWTIFGSAPHKIDGFNFLPDDTAIAGFTDIDAETAWKWICGEIKNSGIKELQDGLDDVLADAKEDGFDLDAITASVNGEIGFILTLDKTAKTTFPIGKNIQSIPEPSLLIVLKVKDESIFNLLEDELTDKENPAEGLAQRSDSPGRKALVLKTGVPFIPGPATIVQTNDCLMIASNSKIIDRALSVKEGKSKGLIDTDEFKELSKGMPETGNGF